jgi:hypothetical protein
MKYGRHHQLAEPERDAHGQRRPGIPVNGKADKPGRKIPGTYRE